MSTRASNANLSNLISKIVVLDKGKSITYDLIEGRLSIETGYRKIGKRKHNYHRNPIYAPIKAETQEKNPEVEEIEHIPKNEVLEEKEDEFEIKIDEFESDYFDDNDDIEKLDDLQNTFELYLNYD